MTKLELFTHQYNRLKRLYSFYEVLVMKTPMSTAQKAFDNCTRINHLLFDLHVKYNNNEKIPSEVISSD